MTRLPPADEPGGWYAVARSEDIDSPCLALLSGRRLVVFRTRDGRACILPDRCLHRGGALHGGIVVGSAIECPYHRWQWRGDDGNCVGIPGVLPSTIGKGVALQAFPATERCGLIWTSLGQPGCAPPEFRGFGVDACCAAAEPVDVTAARAPVTVASANDDSVLIEACSPVRNGVWRVFTVTVKRPPADAIRSA